MDPLSLTTTVFAISKSIILWIEQRNDKDEIILEVLDVTSRIHNILLPFKSVEFKGYSEQQLCDAIRGIGDSLQRAREHLILWDYKRIKRIVAFLSPGTVNEQLKGDVQNLNQQLMILMTAIAVAGYFRDRPDAFIESAPVKTDTQDAPTSSDSPVLDNITDTEVREFWRDYIGAKVSFVPKDVFLSRLQTWSKHSLSPGTCDELGMRLDAYGIGGVTPSNLSELVGCGTLQGILMLYTEQRKTTSGTSGKAEIVVDNQLRAPVLVWIDDNPRNNAREVAYARRCGITVIQLESTAVAKAWIDENKEFLQENDHPYRIRFISDNVRLETEPGVGEYLNPTAGENILRFLRGRKYKAPVLIYTGFSISTTSYVSTFNMAGSTTYAATCLRYITAFAAGRNDDLSWKEFDAF